MSDVLEWHDATALAELVRRGEVSARALAEAAIGRIEAVNGKLNAVVAPLYAQALAEADGALPDGPFRGVPFLLKDLQAAYAGVPMTCGSASLKRYVPRADSELVSRLRRAGLVIVGKTNTPELGIVPTTEPALFGPCHNPWSLERSPGGSSGGAAAAVAAGVVPMAHANDGGGSIRIPASCCGVFGLKPTRARNTLGPLVGDIMSGLVCEHAVTRSVRDSAALLDATEGAAPGDPYCAPPKQRPFAAEVGADPGRLRIALATSGYTGTPVHPDCVAAAREAARLCADLGHEVEEAAPEIDGFGLSQAFMIMWSAGVAASLAGVAELIGRKPERHELEPLTRALESMGRGTRADEYLGAVGFMHRVGRHVAAFMRRYDLWLTPTLGEPPLRLGELDSPEDNPTAAMVRSAMWVPFTPIANVTGQPAMSVPLYWNDAGLPIGVHFLGRFGDEATLFRVAAQLEQARSWRARRPPVSAW
jgi:amidase